MTLSRFSNIYRNGYVNGCKRGTWALLINYNGYIELPPNRIDINPNIDFPCDMLVFENIDVENDPTINKFSIESIINSENIKIKPIQGILYITNENI